MWIGGRRIVDEHPEFAPEVDEALREYRGPGFYHFTGERVAAELKREQYPRHAVHIENEKDFDNLLK